MYNYSEPKMYNYSEPILPNITLTHLNSIIHSTMYTYIAFITLFLITIFGGVIYFLLNFNSGYNLCNCCKNSHCVITAEQEFSVDT